MLLLTQAAVAVPNLAGHVVMRFLDPDASSLRLLSKGNPFGAWSLDPRAADTGGSDAEEKTEVVGNNMAEASMEEKAEKEDFDILTESLGGFG